MGRGADLFPKPRVNLTRFHGVFAPVSDTQLTLPKTPYVEITGVAVIITKKSAVREEMTVTNEFSRIA